LNWALEGLERLIARGHFMAMPASMAAEKEKARTDSDTVAGWTESVEPVLAETASSGSKLSAVLCNYQSWCNAMGFKPVSRVKFLDRLKTLIPGLKVGRRSKNDRTETLNLSLSESAKAEF
jgi:phage/plasmid-associated DNA primase